MAIAGATEDASLSDEDHVELLGESFQNGGLSRIVVDSLAPSRPVNLPAVTPAELRPMPDVDDGHADSRRPPAHEDSTIEEDFEELSWTNLILSRAINAWQTEQFR